MLFRLVVCGAKRVLLLVRPKDFGSTGRNTGSEDCMAFSELKEKNVLRKGRRTDQIPVGVFVLVG